MVTNLIAIVEGNTNAKLVDSKLKEKWSRQLGRRGSLRQFVQHSLSGKMNLKWIEGKSPLIRLLHLKKNNFVSHLVAFKTTFPEQFRTMKYRRTQIEWVSKGANEKSNETRENACDQVTIGVTLASDWSKGQPQFLDQSQSKVNQQLE